MQVVFLEKFLKDLDKIKDNATQERVARAIEKLEAASSLEVLSSIKKLTGFTNFYRLRIGDYRIGLILEGNVVELTRIAHRKDIYRLFP